MTYAQFMPSTKEPKFKLTMHAKESKPYYL